MNEGFTESDVKMSVCVFNPEYIICSSLSSLLTSKILIYTVTQINTKRKKEMSGYSYVPLLH